MFNTSKRPTSRMLNEDFLNDETVEELILDDTNNVSRGDTNSIFKELCETIQIDFHSTLLDLKNSPELGIWPVLYEHSLGLHSALNILHEKEPTHNGVKLANRHAFLEVRGYELLLCEQTLLEEFDLYKDTSILAGLICNNKEFRRIYALWRWCQRTNENEGGFCDLADEYKSLGKVQNARSGSLRALNAGKSHFGIDLDTPAPEEDNEVLERHIRTIFSSIRCCKIDEAIQLSYDNGMPVLAAPVRLYKFLIDPKLTPTDTMDENHQIAKRWFNYAKLLHKTSDISKASNHYRMLVAALSGRLKPLLSMATRTTDRLWCFANAAVTNMLLEACTNEKLDDVPVTIVSIFSEITVEEKSPYYTIYSYLLREDWDNMINWIVEYVDSNIASESRIDDQLVRFFAALTSVARLQQHQHDEVAAGLVFNLIIDRLVAKSLFGIIPFYAAFLPREDANDKLLDIMEKVQGDADREEYLLALGSADFDRDQMAVAAASDSGDLSNEIKLDNVRWLLLNGERTLDNCVIQINNLVRFFTINEDHNSASFLLTESVNFGIPDKIESFLSTAEKKKISPVYITNLAEYECHRLFYFEVFPSCEKFSDQAIIIKRLINATRKSLPSPQINFREMRLQQATARAIDDMNRQCDLNNRKASAEVLRQKCYELIEKLLLHKGWYSHLSPEKTRADEIASVRTKCCTNVIHLYLASCYAIEDKDGVTDAGWLFSRKDVRIREALSRDDLRSVMKKISEYTQKDVNDDDEQLSYD